MTDTPVPDSKRGCDTKISWVKKLFFSLIVTVAFFACVEASLSLLGSDRPSDTSDPFVGFDEHFPLMTVSVDDAGTEIVATAPSKLIWFNHQEFVREKPANTKRVFCLGGSTTFGRPYADLTSYSGWLRELLPLADPDHQWQVINAGGVSYASYRVASVMQELTQYEPDLFIVYTAHNEFLERRTYAEMFEPVGWARRTQSLLMRTHTWSAIQSLAGRVRTSESSSDKVVLAGEVDEMLNHSIGPQQYHRDPKWRSQVLQHYESNLRRIVAIARDAGAAVVFIAPASNEMDSSPFKSVVSEEIGEVESRQFLDLLKLADSQLREGSPQLALASYAEAAAIDPRHADMQFRMGRVLHQLGRRDQAGEAFSVAINEDICPLRAVDEITESLHRVAQQLDVPLVDFEDRLRAKSLAEQGHECLGGVYFLDHVHPTTAIHKELSLWIMQTLGEEGMANVSELSPSQIDVVDSKITSQIDFRSHGVALRNLAKVLHWSGKFAEATPRAIDALRLIHNDPESRFVLADCYVNLGMEEEGFRQYEILMATHDYPRAYLPYGQLLAERDELTTAKEYLTFAAIYHGGNQRSARAHYLLGCIHLREQEFEQAVDALQLASEHFPDDLVTLALLAEAETGAGRTADAIESYQRALQLSPADGNLHNRLGLLFLKEVQVDAAIEHFESAITADPSDDEAARNVDLARKIRSARQATASPAK
jgi:tetratricopeptide (TPR) repeat protein